MEVTQGVLDLYEAGLKALFRETQEVSGLTASQVWTRLRIGLERWDGVAEEDLQILYDVLFNNTTMTLTEAARLYEKWRVDTPVLTTLGEIKDGTYQIDPHMCVCQISKQEQSKGV